MEQIIVKGGKILYKLYCDNDYMHGCYDKKEIETMAKRANQLQPGHWHIKEVIKS